MYLLIRSKFSVGAGSKKSILSWQKKKFRPSKFSFRSDLVQFYACIQKLKNILPKVLQFLMFPVSSFRKISSFLLNRVQYCPRRLESSTVRRALKDQLMQIPSRHSDTSKKKSNRAFFVKIY